MPDGLAPAFQAAVFVAVAVLLSPKHTIVLEPKRVSAMSSFTRFSQARAHTAARTSQMGRACAFSWRIDCGPSAWSAAPIFNLSLTDTLKRLCDQTVRAFENKPSLVAEVKFTEWTSSGEMRHPVYLGLRTDKRAQDVIRERVVPLKKNQLPSG
jgi:hypothetical protein